MQRCLNTDKYCIVYTGSHYLTYNTIQPVITEVILEIIAMKSTLIEQSVLLYCLYGLSILLQATLYPGLKQNQIEDKTGIHIQDQQSHFPLNQLYTSLLDIFLSIKHKYNLKEGRSINTFRCVVCGTVQNCLH